MKKNMKKIVSLMVVFFIALGIFIPMVSAANLSEKGTITVSGIDANDSEYVTVSAYRLMNVNVDTSVNQPVDPVYSWVEKVQTWINANYPEYKDANDFNTDKVEENNTDVAEFYDKLSAAIRTDGFGLDVEKSISGNGEINDLLMGNYLILIENGMKVYRPSAVNLVPEFNSDSKEWQISTPIVEVKSSNATITKVASTQDVNFGAKVTYTITTDVPNYPYNALHKNYVVSDILEEGLTYNEDVKVVGIKGEDETNLVVDTNYTLVADAKLKTEDKNATLQLVFNYETIKEYEKIVISYTATVNTNAKLGKIGNSNEAYLEYTNNPYGENDYHKEEYKKVLVYTYGHDLTLIDPKEDKTLTGAKFKLAETDEKNYEAIKFVKIANGHYRLAVESDTDVVTEVEVDENGKLLIDGLTTGTYYLWETKAPDGYNISSKAFELVIDDENTDGIVDDGENEDGYLVKNIENKKGFLLPTTGGIGTIIFTMIGIALMGLGITLVLRKKKA